MAKKDFYSQMREVLDDIQEGSIVATEESVKKATNKAREYLKRNSPKRKGKRYASGWRTKKLKSRLSVSITVYNAKYPGLTHLLEKGHVVRNQHGGPYGRTKPQPHIAPAEELGIETFTEELEKELNKQL